MYAGFILELTSSDQSRLEERVQKNHLTFKEFLKTNSVVVETTLKKFILPDGSLDASKMREEWFPDISCEVFISHSHKDKDAAKLLASWLHEAYGIMSFIDSSVWGFCDDLLSEIDKKYCYSKESNSYNYKKRNISTAHIHMLLTSALTMMIDKTECLIFLNTPNSVNPGKSISSANQQTTYSPWIYGELSFSKLLRRRPLEEHRPKPKMALEEALAFTVKYPAPQDHLVEINLDELLVLSKSTNNDPYKILDHLYEKHKSLL